MLDMLQPAGNSVFALNLSRLMEIQRTHKATWGLSIETIVSLFLSETWESTGNQVGFSVTGDFTKGLGWFVAKRDAILEARLLALEFYQQRTLCSFEGHDVFYLRQLEANDAYIRTFICKPPQLVRLSSLSI